MHDITVVIPSYRRRHRVGGAIESALTQPGVRSRVIVVVDDLCEETRRLAETFGDRVAVIFNERNRGASYSRNAGLARADTSFVMFLDSDDRVEGPLLRGICDRFDETGTEIGFGPTIGYNEITGERTPYPVPSESAAAIFSEWIVGTCYVPPCSLVWKTAFLKSIGGWDEELTRNDDAELALRGILSGGRTCFSPHGAGLYVYHDDGSRLSRTSDYESNLRAIVKLLAVDQAAVPHAIVERGCAIALYELARLAFQGGQIALGERSLGLSREYGFKGHRGPAMSRALRNVIGLKATQRVRSLLSHSR